MLVARVLLAAAVLAAAPPDAARADRRGGIEAQGRLHWVRVHKWLLTVMAALRREEQDAVAEEVTVA